AHEALGQYVEHEAAGEFMGLKRDRLFFTPLFAISITQGDLTVLDRKDAVVGQRHAVGIEAEGLKDGLWRTERLCGVDHTVLFACGFGLVGSRRDFSFFTGLL